MTYKYYLSFLFLPILFSYASKTALFKVDNSILPFCNTPTAAPHLFYIERNIDKNLVVYDANLLTSKRLHPQKPVNIYWIRNSEGGIIKGLSFMQRKMAYGMVLKKATASDTIYEGNLAAYEKRSIKITYNASGSPIALMIINGKWQQLHHIFLQIADIKQLIPKIEFIQVFGKDIQNGSEVTEKIFLK